MKLLSILILCLTTHAMAEDFCPSYSDEGCENQRIDLQSRRPPPSEQIWMDVYNYRDYLELVIQNNTNRWITCQGQVTWRYRNSTMDSYKGVYAYIRPYEEYSENVSISPNLRLAFARPDVRCY